MSEPAQLRIPERVPDDAAVRALQADGEWVPDGAACLERTWYDTVDWRLHAAGGLLEHDAVVDAEPPSRSRAGAAAVPEAWLRWRTVDPRAARTRQPVAEPLAATPRFAHELPPGPVRDRVSGAASIRVLLPRGAVRLDQQRFRLLDREGKTVLRAALEHATAHEPASGAGVVDLGRRLRLDPVRGYPEAATSAQVRLRAGLDVAAEPDDLPLRALRALGVRPGEWAGAGRVRLVPGTSAVDAFAELFRGLLAVIRANEDGVRRGLDTEFLHDFRVAVRRNRTLLGAARHVLPPALRERFATEFAWLGRMTGPARDLDVHVLGYEELAAEVPEDLRADLRPLRALLVERRDDARADLVAALASDRYRGLLEAWESALTRPRPVRGETPDARRPVEHVAGARIRKAHGRVLRDARAVGPDAPVEALHEVRKRAKRLRYLLDSFRPLFPDADARAALRTLKEFQDVLGELNDADVQERTVRSLAPDLAQRPDATPATLVAVGVLAGRLHERRDTARAAFAARFEAFDRPGARRRIAGLAAS